MMRGAVYKVFSGPITVEDLPRPSAPPGGVVVQVKATGVCRSDWHGWKGHDGDITELPFTPGHELSGVVVELGEGTTSFKVGDAVAVPFILSCGACRECARARPTICEQQEQPGFTMPGSFAEYVALPRADHNLTILPPNVSFVEAAALGCRFTTAFRAVIQQGRLQPNETVAVFGCGGLGLAVRPQCVHIAATVEGVRVIAIDVNPAARKKAEELGATASVDATLGDQQVRDLVMELTGEGADVALDAAGFAPTCENAVWCTRRGGRMIQVGLPIGDQKPAVPMGRVAGRELEILGSHGMAASDMPLVLQMVSEGKLKPKLLVAREVSLEEGARAIEAMDHISEIAGMTMVTFP